jgi:hypothetical protein
MKTITLIATFLFCVNTASATTLTLQDGFNGYFSTEDTQIKSSLDANTNFGTDLHFGADSAGIQGLIRFSGLVGASTNQIASGSSILSASLTLHVVNASTTSPSVYQMLADWDENGVTWNNASAVGNGSAGFQADGVDAHSTLVNTFPAAALGDAVFDVTSVVQNWINGDQNYGLLFLSSSTDAAEFATSQDDLHVRPRLVIEYETSVPAPASLAFLMLGIFGLISRRHCRAAT